MTQLYSCYESFAFGMYRVNKIMFRTRRMSEIHRVCATPNRIPLSCQQRSNFVLLFHHLMNVYKKYMITSLLIKQAKHLTMSEHCFNNALKRKWSGVANTRVNRSLNFCIIGIHYTIGWA